MRKVVLFAAFTLVATGLFAGTAAAFPIRVAPGGAITAVVRNQGFQGFGGVLISCATLTLRGTVSTGPISAGGTVGSITSGTPANCTSATVLLFSPAWTIVAQTLLVSGGALSGILGTINNAQFQVAGLCLYTGNFGILLLATAGAASLTVLGGNATSPLCGNGTLLANPQANGSITPTQTVTRS